MSRIPLYPTTLVQELRDARTIDKYDAEMKRRAVLDAKTAPVTFYGQGFSYLTKRPVDAEMADGKKQRVFYNRNEYFGLEAAKKSASARLAGAGRPIQSRDFDDE